MIYFLPQKLRNKKAQPAFRKLRFRYKRYGLRVKNSIKLIYQHRNGFD